MSIDLTHWPRDPLCKERFLCTPARPRPLGAEGNWTHVGAVGDGECSEGCCDDFCCPDCKARWRVEAPA